MSQINTGYRFTTELNASFEESVPRVKEALKNEGFGVLFEIDMQRTLKKKLGIDFRPYLVIGACNPPFAKEALQAETEVGLLLPCHVIIYQDGDKTIVSTVDPVASLGLAHNPALDSVAEGVKARFQRVLAALNA